MGGLSLWHWIIIIAIAAVLFGGGGKISGLMGDFAKGIKAFRSGLKDDDETAAKPPAQVTPPIGTAPTTAGEKVTADRH